MGLCLVYFSFAGALTEDSGLFYFLPLFYLHNPLIKSEFSDGSRSHFV